MDQENLFLDFLLLTQMYFREEKNLEFYAERLNITPDYFKTFMGESSDKKFKDWLEVLEKNIP